MLLLKSFNGVFISWANIFLVKCAEKLGGLKNKRSKSSIACGDFVRNCIRLNLV